jgi:NAD(P)H-nitrite reductase large subunit
VVYVSELASVESRTIICRCEDMTLEELRRLLERGYTSLDELKRVSRCGMGPCQGKTCRELVVAEIARHLGTSGAEVRLPTFRPPTRPTRIGVIAGGDDHEE